MAVLIVSKRIHGLVNLVMGFHFRSLKVVEFIMELNYGSPKESDTSIPYLCEPMSG